MKALNVIRSWFFDEYNLVREWVYKFAGIYVIISFITGIICLFAHNPRLMWITLVSCIIELIALCILLDTNRASFEVNDGCGQ